MIGIPHHVHIFIANQTTDMRKQWDSLSVLVREGMQRDPRNGDLYVFYNKRHDTLKILFFDHHGYALLCKRLERGTFDITKNSNSCSCIEITQQQLGYILSNISSKRDLKC